MRLSITPLDTVFFRDGKAFTMGEETQAEGLFPPPPSVVYGALRTRYFAERPDELETAGTEADPTRRARLTALALARGQRTLFPLPRDLVRPRDTTGPEAVRTRPQDAAATCGSSPVSAPLTHPKSVQTIEQAYVDHRALQRYLSAPGPDAEPYRYVGEERLVETEPKIGIKMSRETRASSEGHLYRVGLRRLRSDVRLRAHAEGLDLSEDGLLKLGGEAKAARFETGAEPLPDLAPAPERIDETGRAVLYLSTPAFFEAGWHPEWLSPDAPTQTGDVTLRLYSAAVGKPLSLGGWDMKEGRPKPMLKGVPAGSVYYVELTSGSGADLLDQFHGTVISERRARAGFGVCYVGAVPPER